MDNIQEFKGGADKLDYNSVFLKDPKIKGGSAKNTKEDSDKAKANLDATHIIQSDNSADLIDLYIYRREDAASDENTVDNCAIDTHTEDKNTDNNFDFRDFNSPTFNAK